MDGIGTVLTLLSGVAWTVVYTEAIRIGFTQRTYAVPVAALMLNIAWEWLYAFLDLTSTPGVQGYVNLAPPCPRLGGGVGFATVASHV